jgi:hypothetical protein
MKKLFYLLSFLICINNNPSNKHCSSDKLIHIFKNKNINPEEIPEAKKNQLSNLLQKRKYEKFSRNLEKLMNN